MMDTGPLGRQTSIGKSHLTGMLELYKGASKLSKLAGNGIRRDIFAFSKSLYQGFISKALKKISFIGLD